MPTSRRLKKSILFRNALTDTTTHVVVGANKARPETPLMDPDADRSTACDFRQIRIVHPASHLTPEKQKQDKILPEYHIIQVANL